MDSRQVNTVTFIDQRSMVPMLNPGSEDDAIVMYILVNMDMKMGKGKVCAQVAHSACRVVKHFEEFKRRMVVDEESLAWLDLYDKWTLGNYAKVVLKSNEKQMRDFINNLRIPLMFTRDAGRTQVPAGSLTTLAFFPMWKSHAFKEIKELKFL